MGSIEQEQTLIKLPVIDFAKWDSASAPEQRLAVAKELADACHNVGFVFIINHGVSPEILNEAFGWSKRLFDLKTEEKMLAPHPDGPTVHRGYSWPGLEKVSQVISEDLEVGEKLRAVTDCKVNVPGLYNLGNSDNDVSQESYEIGSEENDEQPNVWLPEAVLPGFRKFTTDFYWECSKVSQGILTAIGTGMGLKDPEFLLKFHSGHNNQLRLLHYPPIPAAQLENESSARMPAHSDWGSITMLFQDDCGGLEVEDQHVPGEFIKATPLKNAIVMNVGDLLMRWSNGKIHGSLNFSF
jgi:isopenicillin N synthase-like dioxygenase